MVRYWEVRLINSPGCSMSRKGFALLDVLVAIAILSTSALALTAVLRQAVQAQATGTAEESLMDSADRVMVAMSLLGQDDLDLRLGQRPVGEFLVEVQRPERGLYRLALAQATAPERVLLVTVVYRAEAKSP